MTVAGLTVLGAIRAGRHCGVDVPGLLDGFPFAETDLVQGRPWVLWSDAATLFERMARAVEHEPTLVDAIARRELETHPIHRMLSPLVADPNDWLESFWRIEGALRPCVTIAYRIGSLDHILEVRLASRNESRPAPTWFRMLHAYAQQATRPLGASPLEVVDVALGPTSLRARYKPAAEIPSAERRMRASRIPLPSLLGTVATLGAGLDPNLVDGHLEADPTAPIDRTEPDLLASEWFITPTEARVALALASGAKPAEIASSLGIALSTVRVHLKRVYAKVDARGQRELVDRVARWRLR